MVLQLPKSTLTQKSGCLMVCHNIFWRGRVSFYAKLHFMTSTGLSVSKSVYIAEVQHIRAIDEDADLSCRSIPAGCTQPLMECIIYDQPRIS